MYNREWRNMGEALSTVTRAADFNVYWGTGGVVDSVIDITHNVPCPSRARTWTAAGASSTPPTRAPAASTTGRPWSRPTDFTCVEPLRSVLALPHELLPLHRGGAVHR